MGENKSQWIKWSEQKPEEGLPIFAVFINWRHGIEGKPAYEIIHFGTAVNSLIEGWAKNGDVRWIALPE